VYFWYDPGIDSILQHEVAPYDVKGVFETEQDAHRFLDWYSAHYAVQDVARFELYSADLEYEGQGDEYLSDDQSEESAELDLKELTDQSGFADFS